MMSKNSPTLTQISYFLSLSLCWFLSSCPFISLHLYLSSFHPLLFSLSSFLSTSPLIYAQSPHPLHQLLFPCLSLRPLTLNTRRCFCINHFIMIMNLPSLIYWWQKLCLIKHFVTLTLNLNFMFCTKYQHPLHSCDENL